jgi:hypothetical protein
MAHSFAPRAIDYEIVCEGRAACVRLAPNACAKYRQAIDGQDKLSVQRRTHLARYFAEFCEHSDVRSRLNPKQFKREGTFKDGHREFSIWTFKAPKWRLYGAILQVAGKRCFVGTRVDPDKKQDKADQTLLRLTAKDIGGLAEMQGTK